MLVIHALSLHRSNRDHSRLTNSHHSLTHVAFMHRILLLLWCSVVSFAVSADDAPVKFLDAGEWTDSIEILGPATVDVQLSSSIVSGAWVLECEYFCVGGTDKVTFAMQTLPSSDLSTVQTLTSFEHRESFTPFAARIVLPAMDPTRAESLGQLSIQMAEDSVLRLRSARLRREHPGEFAHPGSSPSRTANTPSIETYLDASFSSRIDQVDVGLDEVTISGKIDSGQVVGPSGDVRLAEFPMSSPSTAVADERSLVSVNVGKNNRFTLTVPRRVLDDAAADETQGNSGKLRDRLTSRWQLVRQLSSGWTPISHAHYADNVACRSPELPPAQFASKKGLGGWSARRSPELASELDELGITSVTVNVSSIHQFVSLTPEPGTTPMNWQGRTYYIHEQRLSRFDETFLEAYQRGIAVSAILLIDNPARSSRKSASEEAVLLAHPEADREGTFAMPNVMSEDGLAYYGAILNVMAERWSRPEATYGRVHQWIVHNEVDFGWVWTNAGRQSDVAYMDLYQRSLRLVDLITRQYDPHSRALISLTHHWSDRGSKDGYGSKRMLELLVRFCRAEGDFPWAVAYHPYPQNLFAPRAWEDDQATFHFDSPKITPRNIEVLDAYMKLPEMQYRGQLRPVDLSENGFNSKGYAATSLNDQAAGMAMVWKKISRLEAIRSWQYHNWIDNRHEGGLRIGLRKFPDDADDPLGKKPIWHLYQSLGTTNEDATAAPYLDTIGIQSWDDVIHVDPID